MSLAFFIRGGVLFFRPNSFADDPDGYRALAVNLRHYGVYGSGEVPTAFRPPLYPAVLCGISFLAKDTLRPTEPHPDTPESNSRFSLLLEPQYAIALLHWALGLATVFLAFDLFQRIGGSKRMAALAGLLVAIDPILLAQSRLVMTETLAAFFAILLLWLLVRVKPLVKASRQRAAYFGVGAVIGVASLCRPAFLVFAALIFAMLVICELRRKITWFCPVIFLFGVGLVLLPWGLRNRSKLDQFILTTTHGGYTLLLANNDFLYDDLSAFAYFGDPWNPERFHAFWQKKINEENTMHFLLPNSTKAERLQDAEAKKEALRTMNARRGDCAVSTLWRVAELWRFTPRRTDALESPAVTAVRHGIGLFYAAELLAALFGLAILPILWFQKNPLIPFDRSGWIWGILLILSVQLPHLFYWTNMRMRAPLSVFLPLLALLVLSRLVVWLKYHRLTKSERPSLLGRF